MPRRPRQPALAPPAGQRPPAQDSPDPFERALAAARVVLDATAPVPAPASPWEVLADLPRADGTRLQVSSRPAQRGGPPLALVAVCERGRDGRWWPVSADRKAVAVRRAELPAVLEALVKLALRWRTPDDDDGGES